MPEAARLPDRPYPDADLDQVVRGVGHRWGSLRGARVLVTGASGFIGGWMLETLARARNTHALDTRVVALTRDRARLVSRRPWIEAADWVEVIAADVRAFDVEGRVTHLIHCASAASAAENRTDPIGVCDLIVRGTAHATEVARRAGALRALHLSSGAVHRAAGCAPYLAGESAAVGYQVAGPELFAHAKRLAEAIALRGGPIGKPAVVAARVFALLGPGLALDGSFAAGNFVRDLLAGGPIVVQGDGRAVRSYLHAADLATWSWVLLLEAPGGSAWDVGGAEEVTIAGLADRIASHRAGVRVEVTGAVGHGPADRYVPDVNPAAHALGLTPRIGLDDAIRRMIDWYAE